MDGGGGMEATLAGWSKRVEQLQAQHAGTLKGFGGKVSHTYSRVNPSWSVFAHEARTPSPISTMAVLCSYVVHDKDKEYGPILLEDMFLTTYNIETDHEILWLAHKPSWQRRPQLFIFLQILFASQSTSFISLDKGLYCLFGKKGIKMINTRTVAKTQENHGERRK